MNTFEHSPRPISTSASAAGASIVLVAPSVDRLTEARRVAGAMIAASDEDASKVTRGTHPDILELTAPDGKERIGINQVRDVIRAAQFAPSQAPHKVCLVPAAEALTLEAANALLKVLEEPPRGLRFVLLAEHVSDLLPTIVSRSQLTRTSTSSPTHVAERLIQVDCAPADAEWLARLPLHAGDLDRLLTSPQTCAASAEDLAQALDGADVSTLLSAVMGEDPVARRQGLVCVLYRIAVRDPDLLTEGVRILANQQRDIVARVLGDLLTVGSDLVRTAVRRSTRSDPLAERTCAAFGIRTLRIFCLAVDRAHQALSVYGPAEGILLSLFLMPGEEPT